MVSGKGPSLFGRDWLTQIKLNWNQIFKLDSKPTQTLKQIVDKHHEVFKDELGLVKGVAVKIHMESVVKPMFFKPRPVPFALRSKMEEDLNRLLKEGIIEPVQFSDWATPVVPVVKEDGSLRLCGDYRITVNRVPNLKSTLCLMWRTFGRRRVVHQVGLSECIPAAPGGGEVSVHNHQYAKGVVSVQQATLWNFLGPSHIPEDN